jgi:uncharacterized protein (TIGR02996 family)
MTDEQKFLAAIRKQPDDRVTRLVYADWLQDRDDSRGELIRIEEEMRHLPIYSDLYWQLKPRRKELLMLAEKPWLKKMGYGSTDYQPVFADVPKGWKERWRLLRESVERWYGVPMDDVGGPLKPVPNPSACRLDEMEIRTVDEAINDPNFVKDASASHLEWMYFVREIHLSRPEADWNTGVANWFAVLREPYADRHLLTSTDGCRYGYYIRKADQHTSDPQVWENEWTFINLPPECRRESKRSATSITSFALRFLYDQYEDRGDINEGGVELTKPFLKRLADYFPVQSDFDDIQIYDGVNVSAILIPKPTFPHNGSFFRVKWRKPVTQEDIGQALFWD